MGGGAQKLKFEYFLLPYSVWLILRSSWQFNGWDHLQVQLDPGWFYLAYWGDISYSDVKGIPVSDARWTSYLLTLSALAELAAGGLTLFMYVFIFSCTISIECSELPYQSIFAPCLFSHLHLITAALGNGISKSCTYTLCIQTDNKSCLSLICIFTSCLHSLQKFDLRFSGQIPPYPEQIKTKHGLKRYQ